MKSADDRERRSFKRLQFEAHARVKKGGKTWDCELMDISLKGAMVQLCEGLTMDKGETCVLEVVLGEGAVVISMQTTAVHVKTTYAGFRCDQIDIASFSHLRRLLELNLGDPDLLNRELGAMLTPDDDTA